MISKSITNDCFFWNVSNEVLVRIEGASYVSNKEKHNNYLWFHPYVAKKRFINLYSTGKFLKQDNVFDEIVFKYCI